MADTSTFENPQISLETLDNDEALSFNDVSPRYGFILAVTSLLWCLAIVAPFVLLYFIRPEKLWFVTSVPFITTWLTLLVFSILYSILYAKTCGYLMRSHDVFFRRGLFWQSTTILPFNRIQHVVLTRGPFERMWDLASLKIFTAGGASADMKIPAAPLEDAEKMKHFILSHNMSSQEEGLVNSSEAEQK